MALLNRTGRCRARRHPARILSAIVALAAMTSGIAVPDCRAQSFQEYEVKAAFLYNFSQFVEWPEAAFPEPASPFVIGVLGTDPFGPLLDELVANELVGSRPLTVRRFTTAAEVGLCHVLFVNRSEVAHLGEILRVLAGRPTLLVSDAEGFANRGGTVGFVTTNNRIQLHLNMAGARAAGLTISSKLLRIARLVDGGGTVR